MNFIFKNKGFLKPSLRKLALIKILILFIFTVEAKHFGEADLKLLIKENKIKTIDQLLPLLPKELLQNFTFVFESRSPFKDSINPLTPRVVLFLRDSRFIITFTGANGKPGYNIVETIEFDDKTSKFRFYAYDFSNPGKHNPNLTAKSCEKCHGSDPRPIFDSYPLWPGFYGSVLDSFPKGINTSEIEKNNFLKFIDLNAKKGLYKYLEYAKGSRYSPFLEPELLILDEKKQAVTRSTKFKPNERFGISLTALNKKRIFRRIKSSPHYERLKKEILYELLDCGDSQVKKQRIDNVKKLVRKENVDRIKRMNAIGRDHFSDLLQMQELKFFKQLAQVDWLAEMLKISRIDWSMAMEENSFSFFDGILSGVHKGEFFYMKEDIIFEMLKELSGKEKAYKPYFKVDYNLEHYDLPFVEKMSWEYAMKSCPVLSKDLVKK